MQLMSFKVRGMYREMLDEQWDSNASLPNDPAALAALLGSTASDWQKHLPQLRLSFTLLDDGTLQNDRLERVRKELKRFVRGAKKGGRNRAKGASRSPRGTFTPKGAPAAIQPPPGAAHQPETSTSTSSSTSSSTSTPIATAHRMSPMGARGGSVFDGNLPRDHKTHSFCDVTFSVCVPSAVHAKFIGPVTRQASGDRSVAENLLKDFYAAVAASVVQAALPRPFVMGDAFKFWQPYFDAEFATQNAPAGAKRLIEDPATMAAGVAEILKAERR